MELFDAFDELRDVVGHILLTADGAEEGWQLGLNLVALEIRWQLATGDKREIFKFCASIGIQFEKRRDLVECSGVLGRSNDPAFNFAPIAGIMTDFAAKAPQRQAEANPAVFYEFSEFHRFVW